MIEWRPQGDSNPRYRRETAYQADFAGIWDLAVATGMRRREILSLRRLDVDRHGERILLPQTKNGEGRIVYLNSLALQIFDARPTDRGNPDGTGIRGRYQGTGFYGFPGARRTLQASMISGSTTSDTRPRRGSRKQGADIRTVAQLLLHKDLRMAARYQHLSPAFLADAVKKLDRIFGERPSIAAA